MALNYYKLGDRIRFFRQQEKLSQEELSERSGIGVVHLHLGEFLNQLVEFQSRLAESSHLHFPGLIVGVYPQDS